MIEDFQTFLYKTFTSSKLGIPLNSTHETPLYNPSVKRGLGAQGQPVKDRSEQIDLPLFYGMAINEEHAVLISPWA